MNIADQTTADTLAHHALSARARGDLDTALAQARDALRRRPEAIMARHALGLALHDYGYLTEAEDCFRGLLRQSPDAAWAWNNLGLLRQKQGDPAEAEACYRAALDHGADMGTVGGNLGLSLLEQARPIEAEAALRAALTERAGDAGIRLNLAMALLTQGRLIEGWREYEARLALHPSSGPDAPTLTTLAHAACATVLVRAEQGFGDTLQFCRYVPMLAERGAEMVFAVPGALVRLMGSLAGGARVIAEGEAVGAPVDFHIRLMSLPALFGTGLDTVPAATPYLRADPRDVARWRMWWEATPSSPGLSRGPSAATALGQLPGTGGRDDGGSAAGMRQASGRVPRDGGHVGRRPRIGIAWAGGARLDNPHALALDRRRSIDVAELAPLTALDHLDFEALSLGWDDTRFRDPTPWIGDFADTAALIETLDLVISVDTTVAHLAGALGRPVWLLNRYDTCWRWLDRGDDSPWYPTLRQFRQARPDDWAWVIARATQALSQRFPSPV